MLSSDNYYSKISAVDFSALPSALQKGRDFVDKITEKGTSWEKYHESPTIKKVIDEYLLKLSEHVKETPEREKEQNEPPKTERNENEQKSTSLIKETKKPGRKPRERKETMPKREAKASEKDDNGVHLIERMPDELRFMKRYLKLHNQRKTKEELLRFINSLQRAILERRIKKDSPWAKQVEYMQENLLKVYNGMKGRSIEIEISPKVFSEFKEEVGGEKVFQSIQFIKRYVNLHGKPGIKEKAQKLYDQMNRAVKNRKVTPDDKYAEKLNEIWKSLKAFLEDKSRKTLPMNSAELNGLLGFLNGHSHKHKLYDTDEKRWKAVKTKGKIITFQEPIYPRGTANQGYKQIIVERIRKEKPGAIKIEGEHYDSPWYKSKQELFTAIDWDWMERNHGADGCGCDLSGVESNGSGNKIMNSMDFAEMEFESIGFTGKWLELIGDPAPGFTAMVFGRPKFGKSYLCLEFAGYLARNHGKVLYAAREESLSKPLQKKIHDKDVKHPNLTISDFLPQDLSGYDFIFIDSVNKLGLKPADLDLLRKNNPGKSFIFVFQSTKDGHFRGRNEFQHDVDIVIEVPELGRAVQFGRYNQGGEMKIFENAPE